METPKTRQQLVTDAIHWVYSSYTAAKPHVAHGPDRMIRHPEWTRRILDELGAPDRNMCNIAVTGSKGKGTHAILLAAMLQKLGFRVGLFTSPHLVNFLERIRMDGTIIPEEDFLRIVNQIQEITKGFQLPYNQYVGPVGILAAIAAQWFSEQQTDVNVFELGRGALHDDVNKVYHFGAVLTPVFLEHKFELGPTIEDVCREKAGILTKECNWLVSYEQVPVVRDMLGKTGHPKAQYYLNEDIQYRILDSQGFQSTISVSVTNAKENCSIQIGHSLSCYGGNVAVACTAARNVCSTLHPEVEFPERIDLADLKLAGKMQVLSEEPLRFVDGTIHETNAKLVGKWLDNYLMGNPETHLGLVLSIPAAKDGQGVIDALTHYFSWIYVVSVHNPHLVYTDELLEYTKQLHSHVRSAKDVFEAMDFIRINGQLKDGICFLGTQSFVGEVLSMFSCSTDSIWV